MAAWGLADCWWRDLVLYQGGPREGMELSNNPKNVASVRIWGLYQFNWYQLNWTQRTPQVIKGSGKRVSSSSFMPSERVWGQGGHLLFQVQIWLHSICHMIPLLGIHTEEKRSERDTCTPMFITVLFIIARTWKQPRCPSADKGIRKLWYIYTMEYYSAIKKNSFESVLMRWMKLEPIIQSEVSQKDKHQYSILRRIYGI